MRKRGNPQLEHGHTRIANELLEALVGYPFGGGELKVVLAIIRLTYGWQTKSRPIKQRELAHLTNLDERQIRRALTSLRQQAVVFRDRASRPHRFQLNKHYYGWKHLPEELVQEAVTAARLDAQRISSPANRTPLSVQPDTHVRSEPDTGVPPYKEKKERVFKERTLAPAVENLRAQLSQLLRHPLTPDEQALIQRLYELSPWQAHRLFEQVQEAVQPSAGCRLGDPQTNGSVPGPDAPGERPGL
jgi:phage replication O-like protein O